MNIYTIRDSAAEYFMTPFTAQTDGQAKRMFLQSMGDNFPFRHDYILFRIGEFDDESGSLTETTPEVVVAGSSFSDNADPRFIPSQHDQNPERKTQ